jgi:hypothetical protein
MFFFSGHRVDLILDGGTRARGLESTIVGVRPGGRWTLLRPGPIDRETLAALLGHENEEMARGGIEAPGQLASHYAPGKPVRLGADAPEADEFMIGRPRRAMSACRKAAIRPKRPRAFTHASMPGPLRRNPGSRLRRSPERASAKRSTTACAVRLFPDRAQKPRPCR